MKLDLPRQRNAARTRARILEAAYLAFAEAGYARTGIREIAERAEVASSLILRYFVSKAMLFEEALIHGIRRDSVFVQDKADFGRNMARLMVEEADTRLTVMTVLALADPEAEAVAAKVTEQHIIAPLAAWLGGSHATDRARALLALMTGFTIQRRLLEGRPMPVETVAWLARALQEVVDGV